MSLPRFIGTVEESRFKLKDEEAHHAFVRRIKVGELIEINDLNGNVFLGKVELIKRSLVEGRIIEKIKCEEDKQFIELFLGMPNRLSKVDDIIDSITQLGVKRFVPVMTFYSAVKKKDVQRKLEKWKKISLNAIKQCKRLYPVEIAQPIDLKDITAKGEKKIVFYEKEKKLFECKNSHSSVSIFIGGEGGITEEEIKILKEKGFLTYSLGGNILRMEVAVIVGVCKVLR